MVACFAFGTTAVERLPSYPDIPASLEVTERFISRVAVGDVMRPLGAVLTQCALIAGAVSLRYRIGRR
ncbi:hypothetical protein [Nocardia niwae]|uniref:ABC-2 type transporter domain-containing protein n=1 Tax=Nocardia niwae TaxID=626084 RepID=A0ABV2X4E2_9NOCA